MSYNGYVNYETWVVSMRLDNEYGSYCYWAEQAEEVLEDNEMDSDQGLRELAKLIEANHEELNPTTGNSVYSDLMTAALNEVDWEEVADSFIELALGRLSQ